MTPQMHCAPGRWRFAVDRGGTFTDIIGIDPAGGIRSEKVLSEADRYDDAGVEGIRRLLDLPQGSPLPEDRVAWIRMGTTVATNALLERKGEPTGLLITKGFGDLLEIGSQDRPELFALSIRKPELIYHAVAEIDERIGSDGSVLKDLDEAKVRACLDDLKTKGISSVAVVFLHAWKNPDHEQEVGRLAREAGFGHVSTSHETLRVIGAVGRGRTTLVDAYLSPVLARYAIRIRKWTGKIPLHFMGSSGGLVAPGSFTGKDAILSGPAGGVLGVAAMCDAASGEACIGFDMGGTSTDVCRFGGSLERILEVETGGVRFTAPMLNVETVAAGGGSLLRFDGRKLIVGPESAGAEPGPACYGRGGPAAVTDANLVLGRIVPEFFPSVFGPDQHSSLDREASRARLREIGAKVEDALGRRMSVEELALGFVRIANEAMSRPIKDLSVARGYDPRSHTLVCFGGAGGQHACGIARALGIGKIRIHPLAGLLSAYGILRAAHRRTRVETLLLALDEEGLAAAQQRSDRIAEELEGDLGRDAALAPGRGLGRRIDLDVRTRGTDTPLTVPLGSPAAAVVRDFRDVHLRHYGFLPPEGGEEIVNVRVEVFSTEDDCGDLRTEQERVTVAGSPVGVHPVWFDGAGATETPVYRREDLRVDRSVSGPAIIVESHSTVVIEPGFDGTIDEEGILTVQLRGETLAERVTAGRDPVLLEVFNHLFMSAAEQMGDTLARTAHSVNIKERLDFSCAVFDEQGRLIANAPHIPVHLGAMGETVRRLIEAKASDLREGDAYVTNDPAQGGSHLPDVTVISPVFRSGRCSFFVASRGHHADIGGIVPGSMPPLARTLEEEGVVLSHVLAIRAGEFLEGELKAILGSGPYPARNIPERLSDLRAQAAANAKGAQELHRLCDRYGDTVVRAYMGFVRDNARQALEEALDRILASGKEWRASFTDNLDKGSRITVAITLWRDEQGRPRARIDFSGTGRKLDGNLNAPPAVTRAAVLYVLRLLIEKDIPLNDGCFEPVDLIIPKGSLLDPGPGAAVSGGNVETSQRVVDVLLGALGVAAASQGTMNNVLFGSPDGGGSQYYETIAGGSGATEDADGASAVQVHMTNTRITDPEVLETRFPDVRLERFAIRRGSGGGGRRRGGDGVLRAYRFLDRKAVSVVSERREKAPFGLQGGEPGAMGENVLVRSDGERVFPGGTFQGIAEAGDLLEIRTPGGGGFGRARDGAGGGGESV